MTDKFDSYQKILDDYETFSRQHKKVADYIIENFDDVITESISKTAEGIGVSKPTLLRFSRLLGFSGYPEFRENMFHSYKESLLPANRMEKYLDELKDDRSFFHTIINRETEYLNKASSTIHDEDIYAAVDLICKAETIYCFASGPNEALLEYLSFHLNRFRLKTSLVNTAERHSFERLPIISNRDVVILYKFHKPTNNYDKIIKYLETKAVPTILITDVKSAQMIKMVKVLLFAKRGPQGAFSSPLVPMAITNALIIGIARKLGDKILDNFQEINELRENFFTDNPSDLSEEYLNEYKNTKGEDRNKN